MEEILDILIDVCIGSGMGCGGGGSTVGGETRMYKAYVNEGMGAGGEKDTLFSPRDLL